MRTVQLVGGAIVLAIWILALLARRYPHLGWLQPFADAFTTRPPRHKAVEQQFETIGTGAMRVGTELPRVDLPPDAFERTAGRLLERQARVRNIIVGLQLILLGLVIPPAYALLEMVMFFSETTTTEKYVVGAASVLCVGLGITAIWQNRHPDRRGQGLGVGSKD